MKSKRERSEWKSRNAQRERKKIDPPCACLGLSDVGSGASSSSSGVPPSFHPIVVYK